MYTSSIKLRVRYSETDRMGFVYYGNYASYFEVARVEALREAGINYRELEDSGILLPVIDYSIKFLKPAHYDEELTVTSRILSLPRTRLHMDYETRNEQGELLNKAETVLVYLHQGRNKPTRAPQQVLEVLQPYFSEGQ